VGELVGQDFLEVVAAAQPVRPVVEEASASATWSSGAPAARSMCSTR
jgi:hypothetical protein